MRPSRAASPARIGASGKNGKAGLTTREGEAGKDFFTP